MTKMLNKIEPLDFLQAINMDKHPPFVYCYLRLDKHLEYSRLVKALEKTAEYVPQLLMGYDTKKNRWLKLNHSIESLIKIYPDTYRPEMIWDLTSEPQIKIMVFRGEQTDRLQICMSHILADADGFLQWLYLFCRYYCGWTDNSPNLINQRNIIGLPKNKNPEISKEQKRTNVTVLPDTTGLQEFHTLALSIEPPVFSKVHEWAKQRALTINDVLMAAYTLALRAENGIEKILLPCPADLRTIMTDKPALSVANMTGKFECYIESKESLAESAKSIHNTMEHLKLNNAQVGNIPFLLRWFRLLPLFVKRKLAKIGYIIENTSYTNIGKIDDLKVIFDGNKVLDCYLCGTYRIAPSFQLSASTFKDRCTLAVNLFADTSQKDKAIRILNRMKNELTLNAEP